MNRYKNKHYGNCDYCANNGSSCCDECEHYEHDYYDFWEEDTPEEIAKREKAEIEKANKEATHEYIELDISDEFKQAFDNAKKCAAVQHEFRPVLMGVLMTQDGYMVASNTFLLCKIKYDCIPECLKGRVVITLQDGQAGINHGSFPDYEPILDVARLKTTPLSQVTRTFKSKDSDQSYGFNQSLLQLDDSIVALDDAKLQLALSILQGDIRLYYKPGEILYPLVFEGSNGVVVIVPLRDGQIHQ
ncbi:MAG TPA: hypothetical protein DER33_10450 [Syntrophomonas sp.]|nr:hypothetical protein [Syntrophomonas sp.]